MTVRAIVKLFTYGSVRVFSTLKKSFIFISLYSVKTCHLNVLIGFSIYYSTQQADSRKPPSTESLSKKEKWLNRMSISNQLKDRSLDASEKLKILEQVSSWLDQLSIDIVS